MRRFAYNNAISQSSYFDAGKKSAQLTVAGIGTAAGTGAVVKGGVSFYRCGKALLKPNKGGPPPLPASVGKAANIYLKSNGQYNYRKIFFDYYKKLNPDDIEVHHAIPSHILNDYPNLFTAAELNSLQNLRGIFKGSRVLMDGKLIEFHRGVIHEKYWKPFLKQFRSCEKSQFGGCTRPLSFVKSLGWQPKLSLIRATRLNMSGP